MTVQKMEHVGVVVDDLAAAIEFFGALGLEQGGGGSVEGSWVDRIVGLEGVEVDFAFVKTPDGNGQLELIKFHSPPQRDGGPAPPNTLGIRHLAFIVDDIQATVAALQAHGGELVGEVVRYEDVFWLAYVRGPAGIIVEVAEKIS